MTKGLLEQLQITYIFLEKWQKKSFYLCVANIKFFKTSPYTNKEIVIDYFVVTFLSKENELFLPYFSQT